MQVWLKYPKYSTITSDILDNSVFIIVKDWKMDFLHTDKWMLDGMGPSIRLWMFCEGKIL